MNFKGKKTKFKNVKVQLHGQTFDSIGERDRYLFLLQQQREGRIVNLRRQVKYAIDFEGKHICDYYADFVYDLVHKVRAKAEVGNVMLVKGARTVVERGETFLLIDAPGKRVIEDYKKRATETDVFRLKQKMLSVMYGLHIRLVREPTEPV